ncbi:MAG: DUF697 domain-containing protein [Trueperaceae bacterium]|nr:DUF697 domain-containing protein [Trueperaceae bacterium]
MALPYRPIRFAVLAITLLFAVFVLAQVGQLASLAGAIHPWFGAALGVVLLGLLAWFVAVPALAYARLEPPLKPPAEASGPEHDAFVRQYLDACKRNPRLEGYALQGEADLNRALAELQRQAEIEAKKTATRVFLGTAVSQYGSLDTLIVAATQARMVWRIAHVFQRRPSWRHVGYLYANVLATAFVASRLEDVDLTDHLKPVLASTFGQTITSTPGVAAVSGQISNAIFQGSLNAFLTLRVAMVAIAYSRATSQPDRQSVWKSAVARASSLVLRTVTGGSARIARAFGSAAVRSAGDAAVGVGGAVASGGRSVGRGARHAGRFATVTAVHATSSVRTATGSTGRAVSGFGARIAGSARGAAAGVDRRVRSVRTSFSGRKAAMAGAGALSDEDDGGEDGGGSPMDG